MARQSQTLARELGVILDEILASSPRVKTRVLSHLDTRFRHKLSRSDAYQMLEGLSLAFGGYTDHNRYSGWG